MTTTPPAPTITASVTKAPCPQAEIVISPMPGDAVDITVTRLYNGNSATVRGAAFDNVSGDYLVIDYDVPTGVDVTYTAQTYDVDGVPSAVSDPSTAVNLDSDDVWVSDPLAPSQSMAWPLKKRGTAGLNDVFLRRGSLSGYTIAANQSAQTIIGSSLPMGISDIRQGPASVPLIVDCRTKSAWDAVDALLNQALTLCVRVPANIPLLDPLSYYQMPPASPAISPKLDQVVWTLSALAVEGPSLNVIIPVRTWDTVATEAATWDGLKSLYSTWLDVQRGS